MAKERTIGHRLRELREGYTEQRSGLTVSELAERAGVTYQAIRQIEDGSRPTPTVETLRKLAGALGVKLVDLIGE